MFGTRVALRSSIRIVAIIAALLIAASIAVLPQLVSRADPADDPMTAIAFVDLNADGEWQPGESRYTDLQVSVYDSEGNSVDGVLDTATNSFGIDTSSLDAGGLLVDQYRVEFHSLTAPFVFSAQGQSIDPAAIAQSGSSVQFAWVVADQ